MNWLIRWSVNIFWLPRYVWISFLVWKWKRTLARLEAENRELKRKWGL